MSAHAETLQQARALRDEEIRLAKRDADRRFVARIREALLEETMVSVARKARMSREHIYLLLRENPEETRS